MNFRMIIAVLISKILILAIKIKLIINNNDQYLQLESLGNNFPSI